MKEIGTAVQESFTGDQAIIFGPYRLLPRQRVLLEMNKPVRLGNRALDILIILVERAGEIVSKEELIAHTWPNTHVEETNLRVHMAALRKVLGEGQAGTRYIENIIGRGYSFVAAASREEGTPRPILFRASTDQGHNLPAPLSRMIGRSETVRTLAAQVSQHRFVTIVGPPGIGKTTVALSIAEKLLDAYEHDVQFIDFGSISDSALVPSLLASVLGIPILSDDATPNILAFLRGKKMLLVLDNCEHLIEAAAKLSESILKSSPGVHVLATSREPLRAEGEWVQRLAPLGLPPASGEFSATEAIGFPAIQLFVERALASLDTFQFTDADVPIVVDLCRRLDGIPLAIELAAARVDMFGIRELADRLDDRFHLLTQGRRTALPRQQTLRATLDWSYSILPQSEQTILRRLSIFAGGFSMDSALAIAASGSIDANRLFESVENLAAKSLITADVSGDVVQYRLLEMTRAYAIEKLRDSEEGTTICRLHAKHFCDLLRKSETDAKVQTTSELLLANSRMVGDVRAALDWCFSSVGDPSIGIELTVASAPRFFLSLSDEFRVALCIAISNTMGPTPGLAVVSARAPEIAESLGSEPEQLRALWALGRERYARGDYQGALAFAERFGRVAESFGDEEATLLHARMMALALHLVGRHAEAQPYAEQALTPPTKIGRGNLESLYQDDHGVVARSNLARILWIRGFPDQSLRVTREAVKIALSIDSGLSLCQALAFAACPLALWSGDLVAAKHNVSMLFAHSTSIDYWNSWGRLYEMAIALREAESRSISKDASSGSKVSPQQIDMLGTLHEELAGPEAIARAETGLAGWSTPEILRAKGVLRLEDLSPTAATEAEQIFLRSVEIARQQGARSWELRASTSLARLWCDQDRSRDARNLLVGIYGQFTEGFETEDLMKAKAVLRDLAQSADRS